MLDLTPLKTGCSAPPHPWEFIASHLSPISLLSVPRLWHACLPYLPGKNSVQRNLVLYIYLILGSRMERTRKGSLMTYLNQGAMQPQDKFLCFLIATTTKLLQASFTSKIVFPLHRCLHLPFLPPSLYPSYPFFLKRDSSLLPSPNLWSNDLPQRLFWCFSSGPRFPWLVSQPLDPSKVRGGVRSGDAQQGEGEERHEGRGVEYRSALGGKSISASSTLVIGWDV